MSLDSSETVKNVGDYYDKSLKWYKAFYVENESLGIHYGFWPGAQSRAEALVNPYKELASLLMPVTGDLILDAGCGVGGGLYMAC